MRASDPKCSMGRKGFVPPGVRGKGGGGAKLWIIQWVEMGEAW